MGNYGYLLNKALLPLAGKATISHIIEKFPAEAEFVIGVGYMAEQVRTYLRIAHPNRRIAFVDVDNYEGPGSGPGYSLLCCRPYLKRPFYFVSCDTLWDDVFDWRETGNWFGVARVQPLDSGQYCNLKVSGERILALRDKVHVSDPAYHAFVGLCFIKDYEMFWEGLQDDVTVAGEHQVSNGLRALIDKSTVQARAIAWTDVGDFDKYTKAILRYEDYDFSKRDEALYILNGKVIKFFADANVVKKRVDKSRLNPSVFPPICDAANQFYAYEFQPGETLYQVNSPEIFRYFLEWLENNLWVPKDVPRDQMRMVCLKFYRGKTLQRVAMYHEKNDVSDRGSCVNGLSIPATSDLLAIVPWERLADGVPAFMHGDLQFDNVLYDPGTRSFTLLDWRHDFAGHVEFGDVYYDLAKLYGGIVLNYDFIKRNLLTYQEDESGIFFDFAQRYQTNTYLSILSNHIVAAGYDLDRVRLLVALIYINMSPLHHYPFDKLLYSLGRLLLFTQLRELAGAGQ